MTSNTESNRADRSADGTASPDIHSSTPSYASRFSGTTGHWLLDVQDRGTLEFLGADFLNTIGLGSTALTVLDVGGGHGQNVSAVIGEGHSLTIHGSDESCSQMIRDRLDQGEIEFATGPLNKLPFADNSFDVVICYRMFSHIDDWKNLVAEVTRVSRNLVIVDYPTLCSFNLFSESLFKLKLRIEKNTRPYKVFSRREILHEFSRNSYRIGGARKQFFLPMGLHRAISAHRVSAALERMFRAIGFTRLFGSPVIACFKPVETTH
ncbi:MAG: class I SAM-dependent methyltransferase [Pseudomonadota bacterium]